MKKSLALSAGAAIIACCLAGFFSGCETTGDADALTVSPSSVNSSNRSEAVTFTVSAGTNTTAESGLKSLSLPLIWSVSNPLIGVITASSGYSASYVRNSKKGVQTIYVEDQYGAKGHATVDQQ